ncbi:NADPH-dependent F420 reductase [Cryobacterium sp. W22_MBD10_FK3]|uniref:NADPH-dependent F420 reductase n=1 Tax=Cryobacterium sp. W22_MBD10_FK3 TaxID=3240273 RepID=UPI003F93C39C
MKIGIVGAGNVGRLYGEQWVRRGHEVAFSYARDEGRLKTFVIGLGSSASMVAVEDVAAISDVIVFAPPFEQVAHAAARVGPAAGKVVIDTTNPFNPERTGLVELGATTSAAKVAQLFPDALVVKALHNLSVNQADAAVEQKTPAVLFLAGDNQEAKETVAQLVVDAGLVPFDTGDLSTAKLSEAPGALFMNVYGVMEADGAVAAARR